MLPVMVLFKTLMTDPLPFPSHPSPFHPSTLTPTHIPSLLRSESEVQDIKIRTFDDHEDSVYSVAWSACDAWVFAALSYDGRVTINHVPSSEKYKILL